MATNHANALRKSEKDLTLITLKRPSKNLIKEDKS